MDLNKLETFLAVSRTGSFRLAAESLYLTPPTVSKHIAWLESAYRVSLFRRSSIGVTLTEEGRLLIPYAERILEEQRAFLSALSAVNRERIIRICAIPPLSMVADFSIFSAFKRRCPEFQLSLSEEHGGAVSHLLAEGRYHLGLCASSYLDSALVECLPLDRHELIVLVPRWHRLAGRGTVALPELASDSFVSLPEKTGVPGTYRQMCQDAGFEYRISVTTEREENLVLSVAQGMGIAFIGSEYFNHGFLDRHGMGQVVALHLLSPLYWQLVLVRARNCPLPPSAAAFWAFAKESAVSRKK